MCDIEVLVHPLSILFFKMLYFSFTTYDSVTSVLSELIFSVETRLACGFFQKLKNMLHDACSECAVAAFVSKPVL